MTPRFPPLPAARADGSLPLTLDGDTVHLTGGNIVPFEVALTDFVERFAFTPERAALARGFLGLRQALRVAGVARGFQWVGGSYLNDKARPDDLDVVTFFELPASWRNPQDRTVAYAAHPRLFDKGGPRAAFGCDARFVELLSPSHVARWSSYWSSMLSIDRASYQSAPDSPLRVGFVQISLDKEDDVAARKHLDERFPLGGA